MLPKASELNHSSSRFPSTCAAENASTAAKSASTISPCTCTAHNKNSVLPAHAASATRLRPSYLTQSASEAQGSWDCVFRRQQRFVSPATSTWQNYSTCDSMSKNQGDRVIAERTYAQYNRMQHNATVYHHPTITYQYIIESNVPTAWNARTLLPRVLVSASPRPSS